MIPERPGQSGHVLLHLLVLICFHCRFAVQVVENQSGQLTRYSQTYLAI